MRTWLFGVLLALTTVTGLGQAADRRWQTGVWANIDIKRQMLDFGPGASGFGGPPNAAPPMRAMADVRVYTIESEERRIEFKDVVAVGRRSVDAIVGQPVTFALDKKTIYVRDADGIEHKFSVVKNTVKLKHSIAS
jgi:hypothetical protein